MIVTQRNADLGLVERWGDAIPSDADDEIVFNSLGLFIEKLATATNRTYPEITEWLAQGARKAPHPQFESVQEVLCFSGDTASASVKK